MRTTLSLEKICAHNFKLILEIFLPSKNHKLKFLEVSLNELTLKQFETIEISCSKQLSMSERFGLDLDKVFKNGPSKIVEDSFRRTIPLQIF